MEIFLKFGYPGMQSKVAKKYDFFKFVKSDLAAKRHDENGSKLHHVCGIMSFQRG